MESKRKYTSSKGIRRIYRLAVLLLIFSVFAVPWGYKRFSPPVVKDVEYNSSSSLQPVYVSVPYNSDDLKYILSGLSVITQEPKYDASSIILGRRLESLDDKSPSYRSLYSSKVSLRSLVKSIIPKFLDGTFILYNKEYNTYKKYKVISYKEESNQRQLEKSYNKKYGSYYNAPSPKYSKSVSMKVSYLEDDYVNIKYIVTYSLSNQNELDEFLNSIPKEK